MPISAPDFSLYFTPGHSFSYDAGPYESAATGTLSVVSGGDLWLPTGRVVACDPFVYLGTGSAGPFTAHVEPGHYRVEAAVATISQPDEEPSGTPHLRVAAARLIIKDVPTESWELALLPGQDLSELSGDEFFGYGVDAGAGCFLDEAADGSFAECEGDEGPLWDAFETSGWSPGPHEIRDPATGHNLVAFSSGWGDGAYPTWTGRDTEGAITCFVTDFFVIPAKGVSA